MSSALEKSWYRRCGWSLALSPLSAIYGAVVSARRQAYHLGCLSSTRLSVPVVVVGNITVGGNGKTPITAYIAQQLRAQGLKVGIVSRGYGGQAEHYPLEVTPQVLPQQAGDEPVLLAQRGDATVVVDPVRVRAGQYLIDQHQVDVIVADDGLQHYALARDFEINVVDAQRQYGNGWLLPAGPLREPKRRAQTVDLELVHGRKHDFYLQPEAAVNLNNPQQTQPLAQFKRVHAVAGIGAPQRFFTMLQNLGLEVIAHSKPDHHSFSAADIRFDDDLPVLMTEKDAVKCRQFADKKHWYVPVNARFNTAAQQKLDNLIQAIVAKTAH